MTGTHSHDLARVALIGAVLAPPLAPIFVAAAAIDSQGRERSVHARFDALVVAGCKVGVDGSPSAALVRRCALAARLYREGVAPRIVVTGGSIGGRPAEAEVAASLLEKRLGAVALVRETRSRRTVENAAETARLLPSDARILVVTDSYHVLRCRRVFGRHFDRVEVIGATGPLPTRFRGATREVFALAADAVRESTFAKILRGIPV